MDVVSQESKQPRGDLEGSSWSDLPDDLLIKNFSALSSVDQIRCGVACKIWKPLIKHIKHEENLPWLMLYDWTESKEGRIKNVCELFVPSDQETCAVEDGYKGRNFVGAEAWFSRYGWVLFVKIQGKFPDLTAFFFAFSPFSKETIKLPQLEMGNFRTRREKIREFGGFNPTKVAFSSSPHSPDCIFFAMTSWPLHDRSTISTCRRGDSVWKTIEINDIYGILVDATYSDGILYCVFSWGSLGAFDVAKQKWSCLIRNYTPRDKGFHDANMNRLVMVKDGQPLRLVRTEDGEWEIWRLDSSKKNWVRQASLEGQAAFVEPHTSFLIPAIGEAREFVDIIIDTRKEMSKYSFRASDKLEIYSKATKELYSIFIQSCDLS